MLAMAVLAFGGTYITEAAGCSVDVSGHAYYDVEHDGLPRNNPDSTLYPGDAFTYSFEYRFSGGNCVFQRIHDVIDSGAVHDTGSDRTSAGSRGTVDGVAEILVPESLDCLTDVLGGWAVERGDSKSCGSVQLTVSAKERRCSTNPEGITHCWYVPHSDTARITPDVIAPITAINLTEVVLQDKQLYDARNLDGTSYPWDPIGIEHEIDFEWSSERNGTIAFLYGRDHGPLVEEGGFECQKECAMTMFHHDTPVGIGFAPYEHETDNGGGIYAYTAESKGDAGRVVLRYDVSVRNIQEEIAEASATMDKLIVLHEPVYDHYAYTVLNDGKKTAYDDRHAVVLRYNGSMGTGPDDAPGLHPDRRSKINGFYPDTVARSTYSNVDDISIDGLRLKWDSAVWPPTGTAGPLRSHGEHAMFREEGHGIIRFSQAIFDDLHTGDNQYREYVNVTVNNLLTSDFWGGNDSLVMVNYTYQYPHTRFAETFTMTAYSDYYVDRNAPLGLVVSWQPGVLPRDVDYAEYRNETVRVRLDDYLWNKAMHDTGDASFAAAVVNDTYSMTNMGMGSGILSLWINKTLLEFYAGTVDLYGDDAKSIMDISRYYALDMTAKTWIVASIGQTVRNITIPWDYDNRYSETVNVNDNLDVRHFRDAGDVWFQTGQEFGTVDAVFVNGTRVIFTGRDCMDWCTFRGPPGEFPVRIVNEWGGSAEFHVLPEGVRPPHESVEDLFGKDDRMRLLVMAGAVGTVTYMIIRVLSNFRKDMGTPEKRRR